MIDKIAAMAGRNVFTVLQETTRLFADRAALHQPLGDGHYKSYTWRQWLEAAYEIGAALSAAGVRPGDVVLTLSETRAEFYLVDLGVMAAGAVSGALYTSYPMGDLALNLRSAQVSYLFVEDAKVLAALTRTVEELGDSMPAHVFLFSELDQLRARGREALARDEQLIDRIQEAIDPNDPAILYLTSGATGAPKMSLTSHRALLANMDMAPEAFPLRPDDCTLVFLPSAHIVQRIVLELLPLRMGMPVWFSEGLSRMPAELRRIRPTIFVAPPRVWERVYSSIRTELKKRSPRIQQAFAKALALCKRAWQYRDQGKPVPLHLRLGEALARRVLFAKIHERLGGRVRLAASGAAPLGRDLAEFFRAVGLPIAEGYGLTEAGVLCLNPLDRPRVGSVGKLLPGIEARLGPDGELQVKSACQFNGYYQDETATRSVMTDDGWFATGDIAEVDGDGFWYITGRKKELIVSSNGKKIYPARIEGLFKMESVINQVLLVGDNRPYVTALLTLNTSAETNGEAPGESVKLAVARVNGQLADFERIRRFKIVPREFSIEHGELTPTMKIRRAQVLENHKDLVSELYLGREDSD